MSTNARIGKLLPDGTIKHIYTHFDGYVEGGVGETLVDHYNEVTVIDELLSLGDLSVLGASIHPKGEHSFDNREHGVCVFYGRDRGETEIQAKHSTIDEFLDKNSAKSYLAKYNILKLSKYHLAKILIFVPAKYKKLI